MNRSSSFPAEQQVPDHWADSDPEEQTWNPLDSLASESAGLAKWRSLAVDRRVVPSYVFIGPRGGNIPIRLALLAGIESEDLLSTNAIVNERSNGSRAGTTGVNTRHVNPGNVSAGNFTRPCANSDSRSSGRIFDCGRRYAQRAPSHSRTGR